MGPEYQLPRNKYQAPDPKQTQATAPLPVDHTQKPSDPYSFILDTNHKPKRRIFSGFSHGSFRAKIFTLLVGAGVVIALIILGANLFASAGQKNAKLLIELAAEQREIIRVISLGSTKVSDQSIKSFTQTAQLSVSTDHKTLLAYLASKDVKYTPLELNAKLDSSTDSALKEASGVDTYDKVFSDKLKELLLAYRTNVNKNYNRASNNTSKTFLADSYGSLTTLLKD